MKQYKYLILSACAILFAGCSDVLDTKNLYNKDLDSYYQTPKDIEEAMSGIYNALYVRGVHSDEHVAATLMSDLVLAGGGPDDKSAKWVDNFEDPSEDTYSGLWKNTYQGIYRANAVLEAVVKADYKDYFKTQEEADYFKNQTIGEAYFMRGFHLFRAAKFFGGMPLITTTDADRKSPRASIEETFKQILSDFKMALDYLPKTEASTIPTARYGHANYWVAQGYVARAYLFITGYMTNIAGKATSQVELLDGTILDNAKVASYLKDCIDNSGFKLLDDFRNLWPYSHANESAKKYDENYSGPILPWADKAGLKWAGQDGFYPSIGTGNTEVMFALRYTIASWEIGQQYNNQFPLYFGIRDNSMVPFGQGWGWGSVNPLLYNGWSNDDLRKDGSVLVLGDPEQGTGDYENNKGDHETGLVNKKYTTIQHEGKDGTKGMFYYLYNMVNGDPMQLWCAQDFYYLRFSDILLMHSELTQTADGINKVRIRAGLEPVDAYSLDALKEERLHEFAFEGLRWFDLVRWGDVQNSNNLYGKSIEVSNSGVLSTYKVMYRPETKGLVSIPESEIRLSGGLYEQNPGWE
ncbi:MAG: RagB/SusD family nutrient uptake outer membrane protein [Bacteroidales bacterium]